MTTRKPLKKKGFAFSDIGSYGLMFGVIAITLGLVATILVQIQGTQCTYGYSATEGTCQNSTGGTGAGTVELGAAYNATNYGLNGVGTLASWIPTFVIIISAVVVLGMLGLFVYNQYK